MGSEVVGIKKGKAMKQAHSQGYEYVQGQSATDSVLEETEARVERVEFPGLPGAGMDTVMHEGKPYVVVKRVCEVLGVGFKSQHEKLTSISWGKTGIRLIRIPDPKGVLQATLCIRADRVPMWLATMDPVRMRDPVKRAILERYQEEAADVLARHFSKPANDDLLRDLLEERRTLLDQIADLSSKSSNDAGAEDEHATSLVGKGWARFRILGPLRKIAAVSARASGVESPAVVRSIYTKLECDLRKALDFHGMVRGSAWEFLGNSKKEACEQWIARRRLEAEANMKAVEKTRRQLRKQGLLF